MIKRVYVILLGFIFVVPIASYILEELDRMSEQSIYEVPELHYEPPEEEELQEQVNVTTTTEEPEYYFYDLEPYSQRPHEVRTCKTNIWMHRDIISVINTLI